MNSRAHRLLIPALFAAACAPPAPAPPTEAAAAPSEAPTNRVELPATVRRNLGITFAEVQLRRVEQTLRVPGAFELEPLARHEYRTALPARVELAVDQLAPVEPGDLLYRFQSPRWPELQHEILVAEEELATARGEIEVREAVRREARQRLELARARIASLAEAEFKRADLEAEAAALEASLPRLDAELELAQTRLESARRRREHALHRAATATGVAVERLEERAEDGELPRYMTIDWIEVRAAERGVVEALHVTDGAFVEPPATVLATVDPTRVRFRALALQGDLPQVLGASEARVVPPRSPGLELGAAVEAALTIGLEAHPEERTLTLFARPAAGAPWIRPGVSAFLELVLDATAAPALAIPRSAIVKDGLVHVFFRRDPKDANAVLRVEADMGPSDGRWVAIQSGLMRGDEVVLDGVYELKLATARGGASQEGGHFHADGSFHGDH